MSEPDELAIERAAIAMREAAEGFRDPVAYYVESEAKRRWDAAHPDAPDDFTKDWALESWKILARATLSASEPHDFKKG